VAVDAAGRFTIVWQGPDGVGDGIFGRQVTLAGPAGPEFAVTTTTGTNAVTPRVAAGPAALYVVWETGSVFGRMFTLSGAPLTGDVPISTLAGPNVTPAVAAQPQGGFAVAWTRRAVP
jgi:hypothetical protein